MFRSNLGENSENSNFRKRQGNSINTRLPVAATASTGHNVSLRVDLVPIMSSGPNGCLRLHLPSLDWRCTAPGSVDKCGEVNIAPDVNWFQIVSIEQAKLTATGLEGSIHKNGTLLFVHYYKRYVPQLESNEVIKSSKGIACYICLPDRASFR